jgi:hypothetical protein
MYHGSYQFRKAYQDDAAIAGERNPRAETLSETGTLPGLLMLELFFVLMALRTIMFRRK